MFKDKIELVPNLPGSYQFKNKYDQIIYIGKAKDLKKRIASYFNGKQTGKTAVLVSEIIDFDYIVTTNELESFILELNLIKRYNPKYNILLKDDKSYPYIEYTKKPFPKLKIVRYLKIKRKEDRVLFGPYQNSKAARQIVNLLNRLYPLKKCKGMPKEVCLYYHIDECLGYCVKKPDPEIINKMEKEILSFLRGNDKVIKNKINDKIKLHSKNLNYEAALDLKNELDNIEIILKKQKTDLRDYTNRDIINHYFHKGYIALQIFFIRNGKLLGSHQDMFPIVTSENEDMEYYIANYYQKHEIPNEILISKKINKELLSEVLKTKVLTPQRGAKKKLLDMAKMNAKLHHKNNLELIIKDEKRTTVANEELKKLLKLDKLDRIEIFDNSNLFGDYSVSGMVVFINGKPSKNDYRKFKISIDKNDDYHAMKEVIYRRYYRLLVEKTELPDLILVDGGINQINAAKDVIDELNLKIKICGLKKNDKHRTHELIDGDNLDIIDIDKTSNLFHYLTRMQDEVHRFTINYHRTIRDKGTIASTLDNIEGIGEIRKKELIKKFGTITKIKNATIDELKQVIPESIAIKLLNYFQDEKQLK